MSLSEYVVSLSLVIVWNFVRFSSAESTIVTLPKLGIVQGRITETAWTNREVFQFVDVKYAEAPSGARRFKPPIPVKAWDDVYDATTERLGCPSILTLSSSQRADDDKDLEDCLTMTITTPNVTGSYPVLVYIHGEYLYEGSNMEAPPDYLLEKDIVLVAPQYRLGPFGFLSTKTEEVPGNAGVMDVYLALQFIKIFIQNFGGDPKRVTLAGQVGGAAIVHLLTLSPIVEPGLFQQVIYHSGSAIMPVFLDESPRPHALDIAKKSGCVSMQTVKHLNECLMKVPTRQLLMGFMEHAQEHSFNGTGNTGGVQFTIGGPSPVLPAHPSVLMAEASNFTYPAMGGCPRNAGTRLLSEIVENDFEDRIPDDMYNSFDYINHVMRQVVGQDKNMLLTSFAMHDFFNRDLLENGTFKSLIPRLVDMAGTMLHKLPVLLALNMNGKHHPDKTFLYSFDYRGEFNRYAELDEETNNQSPFRAGVSLTDETLYLFPYPDHVDNLSPTDEGMASRMVDLWTSFVINGHPMASHRGGYWPPMSTLYGPYMKIDETMTIAGNYFNEFTATVNDEERGIRLVRDDLYYKRKRIFG